MSPMKAFLIVLSVCVFAGITVCGASNVDDCNPTDEQCSVVAKNDSPEQNRRSAAHCSLANFIETFSQSPLVKFMQQNYPVLETMSRHLLPEIHLSFNKGDSVLVVNGDELESKNWEHQLLVLLEFVPGDNFLTEVHLNRLPLSPLAISRLFGLFLRNAKRIHTLHLVDCTIAKKCSLNWDLSQLENLTRFKLASSSTDVSFVLQHLPSSLKVLDLAANTTVSAHFLNAVLARLPCLEELRLEDIKALLPVCPKAIFALENLVSVHFIRSNFAPLIVNELQNYAPKWTHFSATSVKMTKFSLQSLTTMKSLVHLDLSGQEYQLLRSFHHSQAFLIFFPNCNL